MPKVTFLNEVITVEVDRGKSIKDAAEQAGVNLYEGFWKSYHCSGWGGCLGSGCRVWATCPPDALSPRTGFEKIRPTHSGSIRLACQAKVLGDVDVRTQPGALLDTPPNMKWEPDPRASRWKDRLAPKEGGGGKDEDEEEDADKAG